MLEKQKKIIFFFVKIDIFDQNWLSFFLKLPLNILFKVEQTRENEQVTEKSNGEKTKNFHFFRKKFLNITLSSDFV